MRKIVLIILHFCFLLLLMSACESDKPTVYYGGLIYGKADMEPVEAIVVKDGKFSYAGSFDGALQTAGRGCKRIDLQERAMLPSFFDAHAHPNLGSLLDLRDFTYEGDLPTPEEYAEHIREYLESHPDTQALRGTGWDNAVFS